MIGAGPQAMGGSRPSPLFFMEDAVSKLYDKNGVVMHHGDCLHVMATLEADSFDSIVTDPPYGISFMGKNWDHGVPGEEFWAAALRVAKPGAYLLAFGGTRTYHRLTCAIDDAGWEIRDCLQWLYGSGFPKSMDISKALDKSAGAEREVVGIRKQPDIRGGSFQNRSRNNVFGNVDVFDTSPSTDEAKQWEGWGTALKPAYEPIILARKPLIGTVVQNVQQHGVGGLNIDACRVGVGESCPGGGGLKGGAESRHEGWRRESHSTGVATEPHSQGRWPSNVILSHSLDCGDGSGCSVDCPIGMLDEQAGPQASGGTPARRFAAKTKNAFGEFNGEENPDGIGSSSGNVSRFFYCAKADGKERRKSKHPTVKPLELMRYLIRLVTPIGGVVLDPFMGSGSTIEAAREEHCRAIGIDLSEEYVRDSIARLSQGTFGFN